MIPGSKHIWKKYAIAMIWLLVLLWPLLGIHADGTLTFSETWSVWIWIAGVLLGLLMLVLAHRSSTSRMVRAPVAIAMEKINRLGKVMPGKVWMVLIISVSLLFPFLTDRYAQDVAINVLVYVCLGLGLNIVVGLAGMLDLGYIAFYGVGAYTYALLSIHYQFSFWLSLPIAACFAAIAGCIIGYPTLRMRGDYLAIVTLGFGEIVRIILNNWMELTNGPNGILGINAPGLMLPQFSNGIGFEYIYLKKLHYLYYIVLLLCVFTVIAVHRLNFSRIGRAWEAIREDETVAELMGVNIFRLKLLAYAMGAVFGGLAGAFFAARMRFVSPESFTFIESAMVLAMVVLGGMGSIPGIILGAMALIVLPELFREVELYRMLAFGAAMTVMMLFRPKGLIPAKRVGTRSEEREG
ncbi:MAG: high-affinity branched-chain amino acid ABC transporter permease LivM [Desulfobacteraceae bacterium]|nr:MAG: high-affinity branched-chain amino acid ABC transporter permease LivM [Desulfobacteraceae bacterium]